MRNVLGGIQGVDPKAEIQRPKETRNPKAKRTVSSEHRAMAGQSPIRRNRKRPAAPGDKSPRTETTQALKGSPGLAGLRLTRFASDPLDGRLGFKDGGLAGPALELNSWANKDSHGRKRPKLPPHCTHWPMRGENMTFTLTDRPYYLRTGVVPAPRAFLQ